MKDQDILMNTLISLKHLVSFFSTFASEAGSTEVDSIADDAYQEMIQQQRNVYQCMVDKGFMKVQYQTKSAVEKEYKKYKNKSCNA